VENAHCHYACGKKTKMVHEKLFMPQYLSQFDTNYIIFRHFQIFKKKISKIFFSEGNSRI
jgi:hypothetical protein